MHPRINRWFPEPALAVSSSEDGWTRIHLSLEPDGLQARAHSWALDPSTAMSREWMPAETAELSVLEETQRMVRMSHVRGVVDTEVNPHEDSRGLIADVSQLSRLSVTVGRSTMEICVARCADGIRVDLPIDREMQILGLGEKTGELDKRGRSWMFWNSDDPVHTPDRDPLYQSIPVAYLRASDQTITAFSDSPAQQYFDVGESDPGALRIEVYEPVVDLYLRTDPGLPEAVRAYGALTGAPPLPPEWALGFQQCRYSYYPESRVLEIAERMRELEVPCDVIYLDIHYMDGYRVFTWDPNRFPDPRRMLDRLHEMGYRVVTIVDPGVKVDPGYEVYSSGHGNDLFLRRAAGGTYVGQVWPGDAAFPDFTRTETRKWWAEQHPALFDPGIDGIWNDMNEPSDFTGDHEFRPDFTVPSDVTYGPPPSPEPFERVHNAYANGMNQATRQAFADHKPDARGFVLTRAGYAGIQRDAAVWTGDNHSWWDHIRIQIPMMLNLSLSGVAFCGADTGGFQSDATPEMFARWVQSACLLPFFRAHSALDTRDQEPWEFGDDVLAASRSAIRLRYSLLPYIYTLFENATRTGEPVVRPLVWHFPDDERVRDRADCFLLGEALLVAPVREPGLRERSVYLPDGGWYDFWTGASYEGGAGILADAPLDRLPLFVRAGAIVPTEEPRESTAADQSGPLSLLVAADSDGSASGSLYADAGEGFAFREGAFWRADLALRDGAVAVSRQDGDGTCRWAAVAAVSAGVPFAERTVTAAATELTPAQTIRLPL